MFDEVWEFLIKLEIVNDEWNDKNFRVQFVILIHCIRAAISACLYLAQELVLFIYFPLSLYIYIRINDEYTVDVHVFMVDLKVQKCTLCTKYAVI